MRPLTSMYLDSFVLWEGSTGEPFTQAMARHMSRCSGWNIHDATKALTHYSSRRIDGSQTDRLNHVSPISYEHHLPDPN